MGKVRFVSRFSDLSKLQNEGKEKLQGLEKASLCGRREVGCSHPSYSLKQDIGMERGGKLGRWHPCFPCAMEEGFSSKSGCWEGGGIRGLRVRWQSACSQTNLSKCGPGAPKRMSHGKRTKPNSWVTMYAGSPCMMFPKEAMRLLLSRALRSAVPQRRPSKEESKSRGA